VLPFVPFPLIALPVPPYVGDISQPDAPRVTVDPVRDLLLAESGQLYVWGGDLHLVGGVDAIAQECKTAMELWQGEYILDATAGLPWHDLLTKGVPESTIAASVRAQLLTVPGVAGVENITITADHQSRTASIGADVTATDGAQLVVTFDQGAA